MIKQLGCCLDHDNLKTSFPHPVTQQPVCIFFDPCHMLKLVRNSFGDKEHFIDGENNSVKWIYIERLHNMQANEGLHLGNKLRYAHIDWSKRKNEC